MEKAMQYDIFLPQPSVYRRGLSHDSSQASTWTQRFWCSE